MKGKIPQTFIDDLLQRLDIVEVIKSRLSLQRRGHNYVACCPFHDEKTPSFSVSQKKQFYHCFGCHASGNAISFLMDYERLGFVEALETLASMVGVAMPVREQSSQHASRQTDYDLLHHIEQFYQSALQQDKTALQYLAARGLSPSTYEHYGIGFATAAWDRVLRHFGKDEKQITRLQTLGMVIEKTAQKRYDRFRARIMFPIRDVRGRVVGFGGRVMDDSLPKYLNSPETPLFHKGQQVYGLYEALQANRQLEQVCVVEGYMDVLALAEVGFVEAVATLGTALSASHLKQLFRYTERVVFCFDGDNAGRAAAWRALQEALPLLEDGRQLRFVFLPKQHDPDSYIKEYGVAAFRELVKQAVGFETFLLQHVSDENNLEQLDGLARMASQAVPLIRKIPGVFLQGLLFDKLAPIVRMTPQALRKLAPAATTATQKPRPVQQKSVTKTPMRLAIACLLQHPECAQDVDLAAFESLTAMPGLSLLCKLVEQAKNITNPTTGLLLEAWRDQKEYSHLQQLAALSLSIPKSGLREEFLGILTKLRVGLVELEIEHILSSGHLQGLQMDDKHRLQELIKRKQILLKNGSNEAV